MMEREETANLRRQRTLLLLGIGVAVAVSAWAYWHSNGPGSAPVVPARIRGSAAPPREAYPDLRTALANSPDGWVEVIVSLNCPDRRGESLEAHQAAVKAVQERVLQAVSPEGFRVGTTFELTAGMAGKVNAAGLADLQAHPDVTGVALERHYEVPAPVRSTPIPLPRLP